MPLKKEKAAVHEGSVALNFFNKKRSDFEAAIS